MATMLHKCMEVLRQYTSGARNILDNDNIPKDEAIAALAKSAVEMVNRPTIGQSIGVIIRNNFLSSTSTLFKNTIGNAFNLITIPTSKLLKGRVDEAWDMFTGIAEAFIEYFPRFGNGFNSRSIKFDNRASQEFDTYFKLGLGQKVNDKINKVTNYAFTLPTKFAKGSDDAFSSLLERAQYNVMLRRLGRKADTLEFRQKHGMNKSELLLRLKEAMAKKKLSDPIYKVVQDIDPYTATMIEDMGKFGTFRTEMGQNWLDRAATKWQSWSSNVPILQALGTPFIITPVNVAKYGSEFVPGIGAGWMLSARKEIARLQDRIGLKAKTEFKAKEKLGEIQSKIDFIKRSKLDVPEALNDQFYDAEVKYFAAKKARAQLEAKRDIQKERYGDIISRQVMGLGFTVTAYGMYTSGRLTGEYPADPAERQRMIQQGIPANSVKIGNTWMSYEGVEPLHTILSATATAMSKIEQNRITGDTSLIKSAIDTLSVVKQAFVDKTFTAQLADLMAALTAEGGSEAKAKSFLVSATNGLLPNLMNTIARSIDPIQRQIKDPDLLVWITNNLKARIPGMREELPVAYDITGKEQPYGSTGEIYSGFKFREVNQTTIQKMFNNPELGIRKPSNIVAGVELTPQQYEMMTKMMGDMTATGMEALANMEGFAYLPNSIQAYMVKSLVKDIRADVRLAMLPQILASEEQKRLYIIEQLNRKGINVFTTPGFEVE